MLNSKLVNSYYLYIKTNLKSMLLTLICISIFMLHICVNFKRKIQRLIIINQICFPLHFRYVCARIKRNIKLLDYLCAV